MKSPEAVFRKIRCPLNAMSLTGESEIHGDLSHWPPTVQHLLANHRKQILDSYSSLGLQWDPNAVVDPQKGTTAAAFLHETNAEAIRQHHGRGYTRTDIMLSLPSTFKGPEAMVPWDDTKKIPGRPYSVGVELAARLQKEEAVTGHAPDEADKEWNEREIMRELPQLFVGAHSPHAPHAHVAQDTHEGSQVQKSSHMVREFLIYAHALLGYMKGGEFFLDSLKRAPLEQEKTAVQLFSSRHGDIDNGVNQVKDLLSEFEREAPQSVYASINTKSFSPQDVRRDLSQQSPLSRPIPYVPDKWRNSAMYTQLHDALGETLMRNAANYQQQKGGGGLKNYEATSTLLSLLTAVNELRNKILKVLHANNFYAHTPPNIERQLRNRQRFGDEYDAHEHNEEAAETHAHNPGSLAAMAKTPSLLLDTHQDKHQDKHQDTQNQSSRSASDNSEKGCTLSEEGKLMLKLMEEKKGKDAIAYGEGVLSAHTDPKEGLSSFGLDPSTASNLAHILKNDTEAFWGTLQEAFKRCA